MASSKILQTPSLKTPIKGLCLSSLTRTLFIVGGRRAADDIKRRCSISHDMTNYLLIQRNVCIDDLSVGLDVGIMISHITNQSPLSI